MHAKRRGIHISDETVRSRDTWLAKVIETADDPIDDYARDRSRTATLRV